jgi:hypothetical protein
MKAIKKLGNKSNEKNNRNRHQENVREVSVG